MVSPRFLMLTSFGFASIFFSTSSAHAAAFNFDLTLQGETTVSGTFDVYDEGNDVFSFDDVSEFVATAANNSADVLFEWEQDHLETFYWNAADSTFILSASNSTASPTVNLSINVGEISATTVEEMESGGFFDFRFFDARDTTFITPKEIEKPRADIPEPTSLMSFIVTGGYLVGSRFLPLFRRRSKTKTGRP